ncbi:TPA: hypothetical protein ACH3X1_015655 [Trebouxia sp. C0004]
MLKVLREPTCGLPYAAAILLSHIMLSTPHAAATSDPYSSCPSLDQPICIPGKHHHACMQGERDYALIKGQTGPLVYPAGFLYIYSALYQMTAGGNIMLAQTIFAFFYLANQAVVMQLYITSHAVPPWVLILLCLSKRVKSIFLLRMFNDGVTTLLVNIALLLLIRRKWRWSLMTFSAALSVKMNVLLLVPPVAVVLLQAAPWKDIFLGTLVAMVLQLMLGLPFLLQHPHSYLNKAFEFSRIFLLKWSVNWAFLPEDVFRSKALATCLLLAHLGLLLLFAHFKWCKENGGLLRLLLRRLKGRECEMATKQDSVGQADSARRMLAVVFSGNLVGIACARTLHFQFYSWYFHSIPLLLWHADMFSPLRVVLFVCIEVVWNTFPPAVWSSTCLLFCHLTMLFELYNFSGWSVSKARRKSP